MIPQMPTLPADPSLSCPAELRMKAHAASHVVTLERLGYEFDAFVFTHSSPRLGEGPRNLGARPPSASWVHRPTSETEADVTRALLTCKAADSQVLHLPRQAFQARFQNSCPYTCAIAAAHTSAFRAPFRAQGYHLVAFSQKLFANC